MIKKDPKRFQDCMVCGKEVPKGEWSSVNAAVTEEYISLGGHSTCVHNVNYLVVIPNRLRLLKENLFADWREIEGVDDILQAIVALSMNPLPEEV